jgi:hypothetical protein
MHLGVSDPVRAAPGAKSGAAKRGSLSPRLSLCSAATAARTAIPAAQSAAGVRPEAADWQEHRPRLSCTRRSAPRALRAPHVSGKGNDAPEFRFPHPVPPSRVQTVATRDGEGGRVTVGRQVLRQILGPAERQHSDARPCLVDRQERSSPDVLPVRVERLCDDAHDHIGEQILSSDLHDARRGSSEAEAGEDQMFFLVSRGFRCIAHDRQGHGRSSQPWTGNDMDTFVRSRPIYTGGSGHRPAWRHLVGRRGGSPAIGSCARSRDGRLQLVDPSERIARVVESSMLGKCVQSELRATPKRTPNPDGCELPQVQLSNRSANIQTVPNSDGSDCGPPQPASDNQHNSTRVFPFGSGSESDCGELRPYCEARDSAIRTVAVRRRH